MDTPEPNPFLCPLCDGRYYGRGTVNRGNGKPYLTEFFTCLSCSVMFRDPQRFMQSRSTDARIINVHAV